MHPAIAAALVRLNTHGIANAGTAAIVAGLMVLATPGAMGSFLLQFHITLPSVDIAMIAMALGGFLTRYGRPETIKAD